MKLFLAVAACFTLSACGAGQTVDDSQLPSASKTVECSKSPECIAHGATAPVCAETYIGTPAVMMSTWDNGKTWLKGNCDSTAH